MNRYLRTNELFRESKNTLAAGVSSNLRLAMKPAPIFVKKSHGTKLTDVDDNEYIDYIMAYGPQILGHSHPAVVEAIQKQAEIGVAYGAQHEGEIELSKKITKHVPCAELVSFSSTGSEAVQTALRVARAYTGRNKIVKFEGHYHGWIDNIFTSFIKSGEGSHTDASKTPGTNGQSPNALEDLIIIPWNDEERLEEVLREQGDEIAAVITEPIMCNSGCIEPLPGYMEKLRHLTKELDIILIFDEVITGYRLGLGGAQQRLGVTPDLVTMGKAVAGGLPLSVLAGKRKYMDLIGKSDVFHMGTFNGNPLCTASALATINFLSKENGKVYKDMESLAEYFSAKMKELADSYKLPLVVNQAGPVFHTMFAEKDNVVSFDQFQQRDTELFAKVAELLLNEGVAVRPSGLWYLSTAHTMDDINQTLKKLDKVFRNIKDNRLVNSSSSLH